MSKKTKHIINSQKQVLDASAGDLYARISELARQAVKEGFTLRGFYYATQVSTTPQGSTISKTGSVLTVDNASEHLFLERGFTKLELCSPLIYIGVHWQTMVGKDRQTYRNEPVEIRTTYIYVGETNLKIVEREKKGAWSQTRPREEDLAFLRTMHTASAIPLTIVATYGSQHAFDQAVLQATGKYPYQKGVDSITRQGRILFNGGLSHFTRIIEKTQRGEALSSSSEIQTSRVLLEQQQGHFQTLFQIVSGQPFFLEHIDTSLKRLLNGSS